uniref:EDRF1 TPR repeats region domain-containing protein n=1 Tax=Timema monikensis TaxID=170555 RepID=A0A7R9E985_9NEOP|nr:unnamed protein product [Timema monikensis]
MTGDVVSGCVRKHPDAIRVEYFARRHVGVIRSHPATIVTSAHYMLSDLYLPAETDPSTPELQEEEEGGEYEGVQPPPPLSNDIKERCLSSLNHVLAGLHCLPYFPDDRVQGTDDQTSQKEEVPKMAQPFQAIPMPYSPLQETPGAELCKVRSDDTASWKVHLNTLLLEKACLVYATLAEQHYSAGSYGSALRSICMVVRCHYVTSTGLLGYMLGRAGDACFRVVQHWTRVEEIREEYSRVSETDQDILLHLGQDQRPCQLIPEHILTMEQMLEASRECYLQALALEKPNTNLWRRLGNIENELGVLYMNQAAIRGMNGVRGSPLGAGWSGRQEMGGGYEHCGEYLLVVPAGQWGGGGRGRSAGLCTVSVAPPAKPHLPHVVTPTAWGASNSCTRVLKHVVLECSRTLEIIRPNQQEVQERLVGGIHRDPTHWRFLDKLATEASERAKAKYLTARKTKTGTKTKQAEGQRRKRGETSDSDDDENNGRDKHRNTGSRTETDAGAGLSGGQILEGEGKVQAATANSSELIELFQNSLKHLESGILAFQKVQDQGNLSLLHSNIGRLMRLSAHSHSPHSDTRTNFGGMERHLYNKALSSYRTALQVLGHRRNNPAIWDTVTWELSTTLYSMATLLQDYPDLTNKTSEEAEREVVELFMKALKFCDMDTTSPRQLVYQFRAAKIHHCLGSLYHKTFRVLDLGDSRRKNVLQLTRLHYDKSSLLLARLKETLEFLTVQLERVALQEFLLDNASSFSSKVKLLHSIILLLLECAPLLHVLEERTKVLKVQDAPGTSGGDQGNCISAEELEQELPLLRLLQQRLQFCLRSLAKLHSGRSRAETAAKVYKEMYSLSLQSSSEQPTSLVCHLIQLLSSVQTMLRVTGKGGRSYVDGVTGKGGRSSVDGVTDKVGRSSGVGVTGKGGRSSVNGVTGKGVWSSVNGVTGKGYRSSVNGVTGKGYRSSGVGVTGKDGQIPLDLNPTLIFESLKPPFCLNSFIKDGKSSLLVTLLSSDDCDTIVTISSQVDSWEECVHQGCDGDRSSDIGVNVESGMKAWWQSVVS